MTLHHYIYGDYKHTPATVRENKMDWTLIFNRLQSVGLIRFIQEDEP